MRFLALSLLGLALVACAGTSNGTPFAVTVDPAALNASCPQASAHVMVGGAEAAPTYTAALGGPAVTHTFVVRPNVIAEVEAHCLSADGTDLGMHKRILYGSSSSGQVNVTVGAPVAGDTTEYAAGSGTVQPSIR